MAADATTAPRPRRRWRVVLIVVLLLAIFVVGFLLRLAWLGGVFTNGWVFLWPPVFTLPFIFAFLIFPILMIWYFYRMISGIIRASDERAY